MKNFHRTLILGCSLVALAGCGADEIVSPGTGGNVIINNPSPTPTPTPTPGQTGAVAATDCPFISDPQGLTNRGTISGPTGTYRLCQLPARFNRSSQLQFTPSNAAVIYLIDGQVDVGTDGGPAADAGWPKRHQRRSDDRTGRDPPVKLVRAVDTLAIIKTYC